MRRPGSSCFLADGSGIVDFCPEHINPLVGLAFDHPLAPTCEPKQPGFEARTRRLRPRGPTLGKRLDGLTSPQNQVDVGCCRFKGRKERFGARKSSPLNYFFFDRRRSVLVSRRDGASFWLGDQAPHNLISGRRLLAGPQSCIHQGDEARDRLDQSA